MKKLLYAREEESSQLNATTSKMHAFRYFLSVFWIFYLPWSQHNSPKLKARLDYFLQRMRNIFPFPPHVEKELVKEAINDAKKYSPHISIKIINIETIGGKQHDETIGGKHHDKINIKLRLFCDTEQHFIQLDTEKVQNFKVNFA